MTWSIIARDEAGGFGLAVASRFFAVGSLTLHSRAEVGALSTQALMNPLFGPQGLEALAAGQSPATALAALLAADPGRSQRQIHLLGASGEPVAHTGADCIDWCGHRVFADFSVAGNMLAGPQVLDACAQAFVAQGHLPMAERLLAAMVAAEQAGGDKRGRQAAALRVQGIEAYPSLDLRVDDHPDPLAELDRLYRKSLERYQPFLACLPGRGRPAGLLQREQIEEHIAQFHAVRGDGAVTR